MKRCALAVFNAVMLPPLLCSMPVVAQDERATRITAESLPAPARFWLTGDVLDIISAPERRAFLTLETDEDRDNFIETFWARRAPDPRALPNSSSEQHYLRIVFANEKYGVAGSQVLGCKTDPGRTYVDFGPPDSIESHRAGEKSCTACSEDTGASPYP